MREGSRGRGWGGRAALGCCSFPRAVRAPPGEMFGTHNPTTPRVLTQKKLNTELVVLDQLVRNPPIIDALLSLHLPSASGAEQTPEAKHQHVG